MMTGANGRLNCLCLQFLKKRTRVENQTILRRLDVGWVGVGRQANYNKVGFEYSLLMASQSLLKPGPICVGNINVESR